MRYFFLEAQKVSQSLLKAARFCLHPTGSPRQAREALELFSRCGQYPGWLRRCESQPERGRAGLEAAHDEVNSLRGAA